MYFLPGWSFHWCKCGIVLCYCHIPFSFPLNLLIFALYILVLLYRVHVHSKILYFSSWLIPLPLCNALLIFCSSLCFKVCFVWHEYKCPSFIFMSISIGYLSPFLHLLTMCILASEVSLLQAAYELFFLNPSITLYKVIINRYIFSAILFSFRLLVIPFFCSPFLLHFSGFL